MRAKAKIGSLAVDPCPATELEFRPPEAAGFFLARFLPAPGSICPGSLCSGCFRIGFPIAPVGSVAVAVFDFDLCRNCSAIEIVVGLDPVRRRFAGSGLFYFAVAAAALALVFVSDAASTDRSSF